jgi:DNA-binding PadR family transcriptional regulator
MLGEFEYLLITTAARLGNEAYGAVIREELGAATGRKCSIGALYTTIDRLETKGLLKTWKDFYDAITRVSRGVSWAANRTRVPS